MKKWLIIGGIVVFIIILIASLGDDDSNDSKSNDDGQEKTWQTVYTLTGSGTRKTPVFELSGGQARLKYEYQGEMEVGMFAVYVVDEGKDIMTEGGLPEVITTEVSENSETALHKRRGKYYLDINGVGRWTVTVEEFK